MKASQANALPTIVMILSTYMDNADICVNCCNALRNMTFNNGKQHIRTHTKKKKVFVLIV